MVGCWVALLFSLVDPYLWIFSSRHRHIHATDSAQKTHSRGRRAKIRACALLGIIALSGADGVGDMDKRPRPHDGFVTTQPVLEGGPLLRHVVSVIELPRHEVEHGTAVSDVLLDTSEGSFEGNGGLCVRPFFDLLDRPTAVTFEDSCSWPHLQEFREEITVSFTEMRGVKTKQLLHFQK